MYKMVANVSLNITNITGIDSVYTWGKYASDSTGGLFWGVILIALFIIIITRLRHHGIENAVASSSFACFMLSLIFLNLNFVQLLYPVFFAISLGGTLFYIKFMPR